MIAINRILCPVDYSASSRHAFAQALALARWYRASVTALHVSNHVVNGEGLHLPRSVVLATPTRAHVEAEVTSFVVAWRQTDVAVDVAVEEGPTAASIADAARRLHADLIVMGIHGRLSLRYIALGTLGSVALEVIGSATCPVLVVPPAAPARPEVQYKHILCPVDFGAASLRAVEYALSLAQETAATLVLLYVVDPSDAAQSRETYDTRPRPLTEDEARRAMSRLIPQGLRDYCLQIEMVAAGTAHEEILRFANGLRADLIVMGTGARSAAEVMLLGSTADPVIRRAPCPVLTVRPSTH